MAKSKGLGDYIKLMRSIEDWEWYKTPSMLQVFLDLILNANYEDKTWQGKTVKRGSIATSAASIAARTGLSTIQVYRCLAKLEESGEIWKQACGRFSIITIRNYNKYQGRVKTEPRKSDGKSGKSATNTTGYKYDYKRGKMTKKGGNDG